MRKLIYILGVVILTHQISWAQNNGVQTDQIGVRNKVRVTQGGHFNNATSFQKGFRNRTIIFQSGHLNQINTKQYGVGHKLCLLQEGIYNTMDINQGCANWLCSPCNKYLFLKIIQKNKYNYSYINQKGNNSSILLKQVYKNNNYDHQINQAYLSQGKGTAILCNGFFTGCTGNNMDVFQRGKGIYIDASQNGSFNYLYTRQFGCNNYIKGSQLGLNNNVTIVQMN